MYIPAICKVCSFVAPSGIAGHGKVTVQNSTSMCPRCRSESAILDGYFELQEDLIRLIEGPDFTKRVLEAMQSAVSDIAYERATPKQAVDRLNLINRPAGSALKEWINIGISFASLMVATASLMLAYSETRGNADPVMVAMDTFSEQMQTIEQYDARNHDTKDSSKFTYGQLSTKANRANKNDIGSTRPMNRKERRAEIAKTRPKSRPAKSK